MAQSGNESGSSGGGGGATAFSFDLGYIFSGLGGEGAVGTTECGSRPSCFWNGKTCKRKMDDYNACITANVEGLNRVREMDAKARANKNKIITYSIVGVGLLIVLSRVFKIGK